MIDQRNLENMVVFNERLSNPESDSASQQAVTYLARGLESFSDVTE